MTQISRSAIVPHSADQMFQLVADIESYPKFLPWCGGARVLSTDGNEVKASVNIAYKGVNKSFTTLNTQQADSSIEMRLVEGPFKKLHGQWMFDRLDDTASKVSLKLEFEFANPLVAMTLGKVFASIADTLVDSFCKRAHEIYGTRE
jgi:ribosome-associated toxin RatA of RatAB toxin-antitoxin module